ncbi:MAG TPA: ATP-grasp domain-containing protein [Polyangiaceae bacterium]|nr:ATP-grasp domain-containing protein [Polyangiaceae bacterium]
MALSNWFGGPRLPRAFSRAGFHVTCFGFSGTLIHRSQSVHEAVAIPESTTNEDLLSSLRSLIERTKPDIIVPTDDTSVMVLHTLRAQAQVEARPGWSELMARSLGDAKHALTVRSRKLLAELAAGAGVRAPAFARAYGESEVRAFAARQGLPVVLKQEDSVAGFGVAICRDEAELDGALRRFGQNPASFAQGLLLQAFVEGRTAMRVVVAQNGRVLGGLSALKLETWPGSTGPSSCVELIDNPEMKSAAEAVIAALGYSGFASLDFIVDGSGRAFLLELNPRPTPISHLGERFGGCLCRHLKAALTGQTSEAGEPQALPARVALFPQEWVRDQQSPHLAADVFHDVPWEEPDLVEAYMSFGRGQMRFKTYRLLDQRDRELRRALSELLGEPA